MQKIIFIFFLFLIEFSRQKIISVSFASTNLEKLLSVLKKKEIELLRLKKFDANNPQVYLKLAQVYIEMARATRQKIIGNSLENGRGDEKIGPDKKSIFYEEAKQYFLKSQEYSFYFLKNFKHTGKNAEIYYILGVNALEFIDANKGAEYFKEALKNSTSGSDVFSKASLLLGDYELENGNFEKAKNYFLAGLEKYTGTFRPNYLLNLSICFYQLKDYHSVLKYVSFVLEKGTEKGLKDSLKIKNALIFKIKSLMGLKRYEEALLLMNQDKISLSEVITSKTFSKNDLNILEGFLVESLDKNFNEKSFLVVLSLYQKYLYPKKYILLFNKYYQKIKEKVTLSSAQNITIDFIEYYNKNINAKNTPSSYQEEVGNYLSDLYEVLYLITKEEKYLIDIAEKAFQSKNFHKSIVYYEKILKILIASKKESDKNFFIALEGLLSSLEKVKATTNDKKYGALVIFSQEILVNYFPKNKNSYAGIQRLIAHYINEGKNSESFFLIKKLKDQFFNQKNYKEKLSAASILYLKKFPKKEQHNDFISFVMENKSSFNQPFLSLFSSVVTGDSLKKAMSSFGLGNFQGAIDNFMKIYESPYSSMEEKKKSAFNIALNYAYSFNFNDSLTWLKKADSFDDIEFKKNIIGINVILNIYFSKSHEKNILVDEIKKSFIRNFCRSHISFKDNFLKIFFILEKKIMAEDLFILELAKNECVLDKNIGSYFLDELSKRKKEMMLKLYSLKGSKIEYLYNDLSKKSNNDFSSLVLKVKNLLNSIGNAFLKMEINEKNFEKIFTEKMQFIQNIVSEINNISKEFYFYSKEMSSYLLFNLYSSFLKFLDDSSYVNKNKKQFSSIMTPFEKEKSSYLKIFNNALTNKEFSIFYQKNFLNKIFYPPVLVY